MCTWASSGPLHLYRTSLFVFNEAEASQHFINSLLPPIISSFTYSQVVTHYSFCIVFRLHSFARIQVAKLQQFLVYTVLDGGHLQRPAAFQLTWCTPPSRSRSPQRTWMGTRPWRKCRWCLHQWACRHIWNSTSSPPWAPPSAWTFSALARPPRWPPPLGFHCSSAGLAPGGWKS